MGFVPANDPQLSMLVLIDEPQGPAWGGTVAAPVFREVASQILQYMKIPPSQDEEIQVASVRGLKLSFAKSE